MSHSSRTHRFTQNLLMLCTLMLLLAAQRYMLPDVASEATVLQVSAQQSCVECSQFPAWD